MLSSRRLSLTAAVLLTLAAAHSASAQSKIKLYNTGVNNDGTIAATGTVDQHYTQVSPADNTPVYVAYNYAYATATASQYDSPDTNVGQSYLGGVYTVDYRTTFDLTGMNPSTAAIKGEWSIDNFGKDILINGISTGLTCSGFSSFATFDLSPFQSNFKPGINTLDFIWQNQSGPGAIDIQNLQGTASPAAVPEASTTVSLGLLLAFGLGGVAVARKKARTIA